jgi:ribosomal protein L11 methylase PrmA
VLRPERVGFISYPYEWCFGQLKDAALATMHIQKRAMDFGMTLRDATAYNIQFHRGRPLLIDTLSFGRLEEGKPWLPYRQFCQHFLAPLALMSYADVRLGQLARVHIDGIPLDLAAALLPRKARRRPSLQMHVAMHARSQKKYAETAPGQPEAKERKERAFSARALQGLLESLEGATGKLQWEPDPSVWSGYYAEGDSYTPDALEQKRAIVGSFLDEARPSTVWDLGANTGLFSRLATQRGILTVSFDFDIESVEANYRTAVRDGESNVLPLVMDLTNPSPALGWENRERSSLAERGPAGLAMALALIHHLAIGNNVPLARMAEMFRDLSDRLIVEFVPKDDAKVQTLLATREDIFPDYTEAGFEKAFAERFETERREPIPGSKRVLYLMRGR